MQPCVRGSRGTSALIVSTISESGGSPRNRHIQRGGKILNCHIDQFEQQGKWIQKRRFGRASRLRSPLFFVGAAAAVILFNGAAFAQVLCPLPPPPTTPHCLALQDTDCPGADPTAECWPKIILIDGTGNPVVQQCACFTQGGDCGPVDIIGTLLRCLNTCPVPPNNPGDICQIHLNGVPTGLNAIDGATLPIDTIVECGCNQFQTEACCFQDGTCQDNVIPTDCLAMGGTPQGAGSICQGIQACVWNWGYTWLGCTAARTGSPWLFYVDLQWLEMGAAGLIRTGWKPVPRGSLLRLRWGTDRCIWRFINSSYFSHQD